MIEFYRRDLCLENISGSAIFIPFIGIRQKETCEVISSKDNSGNVSHRETIRGKIRVALWGTY
jgi:hypothetical protein